jgi:bacterioferritin-associated ferredoxin
MYVCLCEGVTNETIAELVAAGARTPKAVAKACRAGTNCGRCVATIRAIIDAATPADDSAEMPKSRWWRHKNGGEHIR